MANDAWTVLTYYRFNSKIRIFRRFVEEYSEHRPFLTIASKDIVSITHIFVYIFKMISFGRKHTAKRKHMPCATLFHFHLNANFDNSLETFENDSKKSCLFHSKSSSGDFHFALILRGLIMRNWIYSTA